MQIKTKWEDPQSERMNKNSHTNAEGEGVKFRVQRYYGVTGMHNKEGPSG